jgi:steroid delta-isomerase-like uncharacterized protein
MQNVNALALENIEAYNSRDWQRFKESLAADVVYEEFGTQRHIKGAEQLIEAWQAWADAISDVKGTITQSVASGDTVSLEITWSGTHTGPLAGPGGTIPASGKHISVPSAAVLTFEGEKLREEHMYFDLMTLLQQIGAMPAS